MNVIFRAALVTFLISQPGPSSANALADLPLRKKVALAQLVAVGSAANPEESKTKALSGYRYQKIKVTKILKGALSSDEIWIETSGRLPEESIVCCSIQKLYLFFLEKRDDGVYVSVNGPYGVYPLN